LLHVKRAASGKRNNLPYQLIVDLLAALSELLLDERAPIFVCAPLFRLPRALPSNKKSSSFLDGHYLVSIRERSGR
jgi:hypothetical protein